jgi:hypothetical protein
MKPRSALVSALLLSLLSSCTHREGATPASILSPGTFAAAYVGLVKLGVQPTGLPMDSSRIRLRVDSLFVEIGISREQFRASTNWYNERPARWREVMDIAASILEREQKHAP